MLYCINTYIVIAWLLPWDTLPSSTLSSKYGQYWHNIFFLKNGDVRNAKLETLKNTKRMGDVHSDFTHSYHLCSCLIITNFAAYFHR